MAKSVSKEQYVEYLRENPFATTKDIALHFGIKISCVSSHFLEYGIRLRDYRNEDYKGISKDEITRYAADHTMAEIIEHFGMTKSITAYIHRKKINYIKKNHMIGNVYRARARKPKPTGTVYEMMYVLSSNFSLSSIGEVFGKSREWVRQVVDSYNNGERILPDRLKEDKDEKTN